MYGKAIVIMIAQPFETTKISFVGSAQSKDLHKLGDKMKDDEVSLCHEHKDEEDAPTFNPGWTYIVQYFIDVLLVNSAIKHRFLQSKNLVYAYAFAHLCVLFALALVHWFKFRRMGGWIFTWVPF